MLEHRYRTLLRWYPADYRKEYGEEIITVLLSTARPGQQRPGVRDTLDLLRGGLTARLRRIGQDFTEPKWQDALALVSLLIPIVMLALTCRYLIEAAMVLPFALEHADGVFGYTDPEGSPTWFSLFKSAPLWLTLGTLSVLALLGARRTAGFGALAISGATIVAGLGLASRGPSFFWTEGALVALMAGLVLGGALLASPGPRRGRELLGRLPFTAVIVGAALLCVATSRPLTLRFFPEPAWTPFLLGPVLYGAFLAVLLLRRAHGRRACALLLIPTAPIVVLFLPVHLSGPAGPSVMLVGMTVVLFASAAWTNRAVERRFAAGRR